MKFKANSYHYNLLKDYERLSAFKEAIDDYGKENSHNLDLVYDLGCGSGVLSYFASEYFNKIVSIEKEPKIAEFACQNLESLKNVDVFNGDVLDFNFGSVDAKADLIICEMLDTALIDEEEVPILNYANDFLKEEGKVIPEAIINMAEPVFMDNHYLQYEDLDSRPVYDVLGHSVIYSEFDFLDDILENFSCILEFNILDMEFLSTIENFSTKKRCFSTYQNPDILGKDFNDKIEKYDENSHNDFNEKTNAIKINGIKITSFTKLNENLICGPTPMLNPCILVPIEETEVKPGDNIKIQLDYVMGGGIETIKTKIINRC